MLFPTRRPYLTKAVRLAEQLRRRIRAGVWSVGSYLPAEQILAADFGVARSTVRRSLDLLERERLVRRIPRYGLLVGSQADDATPVRRRPRART